jgi:hypothetical protein
MDMMHQQADSYCVLKFGTRVLRTSIKRLTRKPRWEEEFRLLVTNTELNYDLVIEVWDWDLISNNLIGTVVLDISPLRSLPSSPLRQFDLPIKRAQPLIKRITVRPLFDRLYLVIAHDPGSIRRREVYCT